MSLILEALKKSEAQRRLGHAPGLMTPALEPPRERGRFGLVLAVLVIATLAAAAAWWLARRDAPVAVQAPINPVHIIEPAPEPAAPVAKLPEPAPPPVHNPSPAPRNEAVPPRTDPTFAANAQERESRAMPASNTAPPPMMPAPAPASEQAPPALPETPPVVAPPPAPVAENPAEPYVPSLVHLTTAQRQDLPPLRLSMHVFNAAPANRFVIIDGHRYSEGQSIAQGLVVAQIRRDGVVIERGEQRFLLSRP